MLRPLALMFTAGKFASWINVDVTYAISGFLPMNMVSLASVDMPVIKPGDNLNLKVVSRAWGKITKRIEPLFTRNGIFNVELEDAVKVLESGNGEEKVRALESLACTEDVKIIRKIISRLDDEDIRVRGEAFSSLVLNENKISRPLVQSLGSDSKNIRGYVSLVLANRKESGAASDIVRLTADEHPMVRACALGALGHLRAREADGAIRRCLTDPDMEVKKSAIKAAIDIGEPLSEKTIREILQQKDSEVERLVAQVKKKGRRAFL